ncbi:MAG TPA: hypothetical protein VHQ65_13655, partial [Thermoanaerobaculia bacterium]|nr:hypothetical protein [Thermoanaerobaculia bacterium]
MSVAPPSPLPTTSEESGKLGGATPSATPNAAPPTPRPALDRAVGDLQARRDEWAALPIAERVVLLDRLAASFRAVAGRWVEVSRRLEGTLGDDAFHGEEWLAGPYCVLRNIRLLRESLDDLAAGRA